MPGSKLVRLRSLSPCRLARHEELFWLTNKKCWFVLMFVLINKLSPHDWRLWNKVFKRLVHYDSYQQSKQEDTIEMEDLNKIAFALLNNIWFSKLKYKYTPNIKLTDVENLFCMPWTSLEHWLDFNFQLRKWYDTAHAGEEDKHDHPNIFIADHWNIFSCQNI